MGVGRRGIRIIRRRSRRIIRGSAQGHGPTAKCTGARGLTSGIAVLAALEGSGEAAEPPGSRGLKARGESQAMLAGSRDWESRGVASRGEAGN